MGPSSSSEEAEGCAGKGVVERGGKMGEEEVLEKKGGREQTAGGSGRVETNAERERTLSGQGSNPPSTSV